MPKPTRADVLTLGLPPPAASAPGQLVERVHTGTGEIYFGAHGLSEGDEFTLRLNASTTPGASNTSLPFPLSEDTTFEAVPTTDNAFRARLKNGTLITSFGSAGVGRFYFLTSPWVALDAAIDEAWDLVQDALTAHGGEVSAAIVTNVARHLAAVIYIAKTCASDPAKAESYKPLTDLYNMLYAPRLEAWRKGAPVRRATDATPTVAELGSVVVDLSGGPFDAAEELRA